MISYWIDEDLVLHIMETSEMQYALAQRTWLSRMLQTSMEIVDQMTIWWWIECVWQSAGVRRATMMMVKAHLVLASQGPNGSSHQKLCHL